MIMWCEACQQDAPISEIFGKILCANCDREIQINTRANSSKEPLGSINSELGVDSSIQHSPVTKKIDDELERIDRIVNSWTKGKTVRVDRAHTTKKDETKKPVPKKYESYLLNRKLAESKAQHLESPNFSSVFWLGIIGILVGTVSLFMTLRFSMTPVQQILFCLILTAFNLLFSSAIAKISSLSRKLRHVRVRLARLESSVADNNAKSAASTLND